MNPDTLIELLNNTNNDTLNDTLNETNNETNNEPLNETNNEINNEPLNESLNEPLNGSTTNNMSSVITNYKYIASLFKIDESYKIIFNESKHIIDLHYKIYSNNNIKHETIIFHPGILKLFPNLLDSNNFFEDEINDIDMVRYKINQLSNSILETEIAFNIDTPKLSSFITPVYNKISGFTHDTNLRVSGFMQDANLRVSGFTHDDNLYELNKDTHILFNKHFLTTFFVKSDVICDEELMNYFPEFNLLKTVKINDETIEKYKSMFKNIIDEESIITKLNILLYKKTNDAPPAYKPTFEIVKLYLESAYKITNNINDRIQFSTIYNKIVQEARINTDEDKSTLHKLLPVVLKDLGLEKKRYSTGVFWYGLVLVESNNLMKFFTRTPAPEHLATDELNYKMDNLIKKREEEDAAFKNKIDSSIIQIDAKDIPFRNITDSSKYKIIGDLMRV